ncbi:hypothetical protein CFREI_13710 (plasmid) [Corynebacterium freiburgense]|nr:hypothetical protein CFREI_11040 [Corynebacterium freiburgense]WJZ03571.1 hypothetical protein CFREI_11560 [Corynebacterium freiburgense]WJZ03988.1 hypothetical protein CFREI_13710 [Corynebacterium freiburgense]
MRLAYAWGVAPDYFFTCDDVMIATAVAVVEEINNG